MGKIKLEIGTSEKQKNGPQRHRDHRGNAFAFLLLPLPLWHVAYPLWIWLWLETLSAMNFPFGTRYCDNYSDYACAGPRMWDFKRPLACLLVDSFGINPAAGGAIAAGVHARMGDVRLRYHTPLHVLSIFSWAVKNDIELSPLEQLIIWFHDVIYEPAAAPGQNEANSAIFARALLAQYLPDHIVDDLEAGIAATALHQHKQVDKRFELILDLDICNFAWDDANFHASSLAISQELALVFGQERYEIGRKAFLSDMLAKGFIFRTDTVRHRFETRARENVLAAIRTDVR